MYYIELTHWHYFVNKSAIFQCTPQLTYTEMNTAIFKVFSLFSQMSSGPQGPKFIFYPYREH